MSKLCISYDAASEIDSIVKLVQQHLDLKKDEKEIYEVIQKMFQTAFDEGRKFQKQINISSGVKDTILAKCDV